MVDVPLGGSAAGGMLGGGVLMEGGLCEYRVSNLRDLVECAN